MHTNIYKHIYIYTNIYKHIYIYTQTQRCLTEYPINKALG